MSTISPQGYRITEAPYNDNPFWEVTIDGAIKQLSMIRETEGDFDIYTWKYVDVDGVEHIFATQRVSTKAGEDGAVYTPHIDSDGLIYWTNDKGLPNPDPINIKGPAGVKGDKGETGARGPMGPEGPAGPRGLTGEQGPRGETGATGEQGIPGPQGPRGETALTFNVGNVTTGENAAVTNVGTGVDIVLDFVVPKGETGEQGPRGPEGPRGQEGPQGPAGETGETGPAGPAGPSDVNPLLTEGVKIATINGRDIYAPQGGGGGATSYAELSDKPSIEGVTLEGDSTFEDLGIASAEDLAQTNDDLLDVTNVANANATALNGFGFETQDGKDGYTKDGTFTPFSTGGGGGSIAETDNMSITTLTSQNLTITLPQGVDINKIIGIRFSSLNLAFTGLLDDIKEIKGFVPLYFNSNRTPIMSSMPFTIISSRGGALLNIGILRVSASVLNGNLVLNFRGSALIYGNPTSEPMDNLRMYDIDTYSGNVVTQVLSLVYSE